MKETLSLCSIAEIVCKLSIIYILYTASEWKSFLLYLVPATLNGILHDKFYLHAMLLVKPIRILLANRISQEGLLHANKLLKKFCALVEDYYGKLIVSKEKFVRC